MSIKNVLKQMTDNESKCCYLCHFDTVKERCHMDTSAVNAKGLFAPFRRAVLLRKHLHTCKVCNASSSVQEYCEERKSKKRKSRDLIEGSSKTKNSKQKSTYSDARKISSGAGTDELKLVTSQVLQGGCMFVRG